MKIYKKNCFTKENFENLIVLINSDKFNKEEKETIIALLKAYCENLYCFECKSSVIVSSTGGKCQWNNDMSIKLPLNDGPLEEVPGNCPIRKLINQK